ncbi:bifunctional 2-polyprenyl-6-hydroxyphenol methylase/3-demethylubiquinol 3-O-methyltransferase UbiG [cf. Phormidesmis sp. LEGE 11477]|uniref:class I SAM-dependent methyltransferase n=1 Tax=cf. Phormidesmis sp. LEGE 11477 TaxID=1828680 RepID=UPI0018830837|nr:class I SAM-dependent methyltransferase [cf. Phormidesmis sp. LEGE 11477]MBE9061948.1 class I SAM-dependent methyltransferase [cf. Phormidesmis sp. LEGE 11477]
MQRAQDVWFDHLQSATHYTQWIFAQLQPYIKGRTLEVGCGSGNFTALIAQNCSELLAVDLDEAYAGQTRSRLQSDPNASAHVKVITADATTMEFAQTFDTIIMLDVLEHIKDDTAVLAKLRQMLAPGGSLIIKVPALESLYNSLDQAVGHHRRYTPATLRTALNQAAYTQSELSYFNLVGIAGWWLNGMKSRVTPPGEQVGWFDRCVPLFQALESRLGCPMGLSLFAVAKCD